MNSIVITKNSLINQIKLIISNNPDIRLHKSNFIDSLINPPIKLIFIYNNIISIFLQIDIKLGVSVDYIQNSLIKELKERLNNDSKIYIKNINIVVRNVFL